MKRNLKLVMWYGLLVILVVSCKNANTNTPFPSITPETSSNWGTSWLAQPVCKPPCWQNITPGMTTIEAAVSILENLPQIKIKFKSKNGIDWTVTENKGEGGTLKASEDGIVRVIWLEDISDKKLLLQTIIASYDNPQYVYPYDCREGMCSTALVYPDVGMFLSVFIRNKGVSKDAPQIEILSGTVVNRVYFIEPGVGKFQSFFEFQDFNSLMRWKGYGEYP